LKKWQSNHPYLVFSSIVFLNISVLALVIIIYLCMRISAASFAMSIFMLLLPIGAAVFVLYNIIAHFLEIKDISESEEL